MWTKDNKNTKLEIENTVTTNSATKQENRIMSMVRKW